MRRLWTKSASSPASGWIGNLLRVPLGLLPGSLELPIVSGPLAGARWVVGSASHGCWLGTYEADAQALAQRLVRAGSVTLDLGANVGFFSLLFSRLGGEAGRVVAFEPLPENLCRLNHHLRINSTKYMVVVRAAVGAEPGRMKFESYVGPRQGRLAACGVLEVETTTLDWEWISGRIPPPDLVNMDIEGGEFAALRGASQLLRDVGPALRVETDGWSVHEKCRDLLTEVGYEINEEIDTGASGHGRIVAEVPVSRRAGK